MLSNKICHRAILLSLAVVFSVFMWSCQQDEKVPVGVENSALQVQLFKGVEDATFEVQVFGDITGGPQERVNGISKSSNQVVVRDMTLNLTFFKTALAEGKNCFSAGTFTSTLAINQPKKKVPSQARFQFFFKAKGNDGTATEIKYLLEGQGTFDSPANWPPSKGTTTTATFTDWEMSTEGKGQNKKISCTGEGSFAVVITVGRID